jgi:hypothetical protein
MLLTISNASTTWFYCRDISGHDYLTALSDQGAHLFNSHDEAHAMRESSRFSHLLCQLADRVGEDLRVSIQATEWKAA